MRSIQCVFRLVFLFVAIFPASAFAAYSLVAIDCPGATSTSIRGINNAGIVVGNCSDADGMISSFTYDSKKGTFTTVPPAPGADATLAQAISENGEIVGFLFVGASVPSFIRSNTGVYTTFMHPGSSDTEARANNDNGLVSGIYVDDATGALNGFLYDAKTNSFTDLVLSLVDTIAQGVNNKGEVVGSRFLPAGVACTGCQRATPGFCATRTEA